MNKYVFLLLLTFILFDVDAQPELKFVWYTTEQGLANNDVLSICQDKMGFMWFGTKEGCSRFDGMEFKTFRYNKNIPGLIGAGWVSEIVNDKHNNLWFAIVGLGGSIMQYDYKTEQFIDVSSSIEKQLNLKGKLFEIWNLYPDSDGLIWTKDLDYKFIRYNANNNAVDVFDQSTNDFFVNPASYSFSENDMWFNSDYGVFIYNSEKKQFVNYKHDLNNPQSLSSDKCRKIIRDSKGDIWIATFNGLNRMIFSASGTVRFEHFMHNPEDPYSLSSNLIYDIVEDNKGNLFIGTVNGLCLMDRNENKIYRYFNNEIDNESINSNLIRTIYKDHNGNIWIGTDAGVGKLQMKNFKSYSKSLYKNSISHNKVQYFCELPNSDIWIATPKGIDVFNRKREEFNSLIGITQNINGLYGSPLVLHPDSDRGMWIGTWNGGFSHYNYSSQKITNYITMPGTQEIINVLSIFTDSRGNLWLGTTHGVYVYNNKSEEYKKFSQNENIENSISSDNSRCINEDADSNLWIGTLYGLNKLIDFENGNFKKYLKDVSVKQILQGTNNNLWFATNSGLYNFNKFSQQFKKFDESNWIPGNSVYGILEDSSRNLWVSTNKGLVKLEIYNNDSIKVILYHKEDGIKAGEFLGQSCVKLKDGTMMFGGTEGFCMFHPSKIRVDTLPPKVVFTNLKVGNENVDIGQEINGQVILEKSITLTKHITLNYKNNAFSVQFSGLQFNMPGYNQYSYKLYGYEKNYPGWQYTDAKNRKAEFLNLPSGEYTLKVKAANSYGIWNNQASELKITILPPWWQTFWFISLAVFFFILTILLVVRIRTYNLQKQKERLKKIVEQRTIELKEMNVLLNERKEELEAQAEELSDINLKLLRTNTKLEKKTNEVENMAKQLHEADQSKLRFFANISHEFRTPLSLIIGPLERCLNLEDPVVWSTIKKNYLHLMHRNSKRLLRLINQVIDFRKIDQNEKRLNVSNNNIVEFTREVIRAFSVQSEQKNISLKLESQLPIISAWFDADVMEKILYNLISNAIKYTPEGGEISVQLAVNNKQSTVSNNQSAGNKELIINNEKLKNKNTDNNKLFILNSKLLIKISDTGIGIKQENLDKIFDRFYREDTNENSTIEGTGIGLAYTKELIELHKGRISVQSELGKGTIFALEFPVEKDQFYDAIIQQDSSTVNLNYIRSMIDSIEEHSETNNLVLEESTIPNEKQRKPVLIVEDNVDLRTFIKNELSFRYVVYEAENGKQALESVAQINPELIISDIMMPVMDGIELCRKIKTNEYTSHIPIILLTAKEGDEAQIKGLEIGASDYITKPFNIEILKIKINNIILLKKQMQEKFSRVIDVVPSEVTHSLLDQEFLQKAVNIVNENMHNYEFSNDNFVELMNYSRTLVYKKLKNLTGQSVSEFIRSIRLKAAAQMFIKGNDNIMDVCYKVGFKYQSTLTNHFKEVFGKTPGQFIKDNLKK